MKKRERAGGTLCMPNFNANKNNNKGMQCMVVNPGSLSSDSHQLSPSLCFILGQGSRTQGTAAPRGIQTAAVHSETLTCIGIQVDTTAILS